MDGEKPIVLSIDKGDVKPISAITHSPIAIVGNTQLAAFCSAEGSGAGTEADPYIIENFEIDATAGISII